MSQIWEALMSRSDGLNTEEEFESAAYRLVCEQVLYYVDRGSRVAYGLVERYEREFKSVLAPMGIDLQVNRQLRYACAIPRHAKTSYASVGQTLLALVLRHIYDESARLGDLSDDGEVVCDLVDLQEKYRLLTQRELPGKGELDALLSMLARWGLARRATEEAQAGVDSDGYAGQPYVVMIRPAIVDVLGEAALHRLGLWTSPAGQYAADSQTIDGESK